RCAAARGVDGRSGTRPRHRRGQWTHRREVHRPALGGTAGQGRRVAPVRRRVRPADGLPGRQQLLLRPRLRADGARHAAGADRRPGAVVGRADRARPGPRLAAAGRAHRDRPGLRSRHGMARPLAGRHREGELPVRASPQLVLSAAIPAAIVLPLSAGPAAADEPSPPPTVGTAGTSFLTATTVEPGQPVRVSASTGDHLYWSFALAAGQTGRVAVTVTLPPAGNRHGAATYTADVFDGLRRRQACTTGPQNATAAADTARVTLRCTLRRVRAWAEPWSDDPLPGTYYLRLSASALPEQD